jgi:hypothetical protein
MASHWRRNWPKSSGRHRVNPLLDEALQWFESQQVTCGISGSYAVGGHTASSDVDLLVVMRTEASELPARQLELPPSFDKSYWSSYITLHQQGQVDIFGCHNSLDPLLRLEVYPETICHRILNLEQFEIRRLKKGPVSPKQHLFYGTNGEMRARIIQPVPRHGAMYSETESVIIEGNAIFVGMHLERLLIAKLIWAAQDFHAYRRRAWGRLAELLCHPANYRLPFEGRFERLFQCSKVMSEKIRIEIRHRLRLHDTDNVR